LAAASGGSTKGGSKHPEAGHKNSGSEPGGVVSGEPGKLLKLNTEHYAKLRALWAARHSDRGQLNSSAATATKDPPATAAEGARAAAAAKDDEAFHASLFCVLSRYNAVQGHGFQAACSEHVMEVLARRLGVTHECFASPLNCYFPSFCSAFPGEKMNPKQLAPATFETISKGSFLDRHRLYARRLALQH
jgi:hypothetical protein